MLGRLGIRFSETGIEARFLFTSVLEEACSETHLQIIENLFTRGAKTAASTTDRHRLLPQHLVVLGKNSLIIAIYMPIL